MILPASVKLFENLSLRIRTFWRPSWKDLDWFLPGCGEHSVNNWILWVLGAHEKHILWKHKAKMGEGEIFQQHLQEPARSGFLHMQIKNTHLRSSSKCVSMPLTPGTEHISRALRKVVHLFTRLLWPPMSFCITNTKKNPSVHLCKLWHKHADIRNDYESYEGKNWDQDFVCVCVVTLHSCPILAMVALPVCSPSMAFSLKNRKILSSSGLSLSGIKCTPMNLGSREKKRRKWIKHRSNTVRSEMCTHLSIHAWITHTPAQMIFYDPTSAPMAILSPLFYTSETNPPWYSPVTAQ